MYGEMNKIKGFQFLLLIKAKCFKEGRTKKGQAARRKTESQRNRKGSGA